MGILRMGAGRVGVEPFDPVRKAILNKEIQGTVGNGGLRSQSIGSQQFEYLIVGPWVPCQTVGFIDGACECSIVVGEGEYSSSSCLHPSSISPCLVQ